MDPVLGPDKTQDKTTGSWKIPNLTAFPQKLCSSPADEIRHRVKPTGMWEDLQ